MNSMVSRRSGTALAPRIVTPEDAEPLRPFGTEMRLMIGPEHTGGAVSAIVAEIRPGDGPLPHLHRDRAEYLYVIEGTYLATVNGREATIGPGTLVFVPRGVVHAFKNVSPMPGMLLEWTIPGNSGPYFRAVQELETSSAFNAEKLAEINRRFATEFVGEGNS